MVVNRGFYCKVSIAYCLHLINALELYERGYLEMYYLVCTEYAKGSR